MDIDFLIQTYNDYAEKNGFSLNPKKEIVENIVKGLIRNQEKYGSRYCPCRRVTGDPEEDKKIVCPCDYHKDEIEKLGHCLCNLYVKP